MATANVVFIIFIILAIVLLLVAAGLTTIATWQLFESPNLVTDTNYKYAHSLFTAASIVGWITVALLIIVMIVAFIAGGFTREEVIDALLSKEKLTKEDFANLRRGEKEVSSALTTSIILLVTMAILLIAIIAVGILSIVGVVYLEAARKTDAQAKKAWEAGIAAAVTSLAGGVMLIVAFATYWVVRGHRSKEAKEIEKKEDKLREKDPKYDQKVKEHHKIVPPPTVSSPKKSEEVDYDQMIENLQRLKQEKEKN